MMKLKPCLKSLAKAVLFLKLIQILCLTSGCSSSNRHTYSRENLVNSIQSICKNEYDIAVKTKLMGQTLWIYLPLEDIFEKADKPEKYLERFAIEHNRDEFKQGTLKFEYFIKAIPEQEKFEEIKYNKSALEKINNVWKVLRRVLFSMDSSKEDTPRLFSLVVADIKNGLKMQELFYLEDLKKVSYEFISWGEYRHRAIQDMQIAPEMIGDKDGLTLDYREITWEEFIASQIQHRIKLKFQKPEVDQNADIDQEILKIIIYTIKTYQFKDFKDVELNNLLTKNNIILNRAAIWAKPIE